MKPLVILSSLLLLGSASVFAQSNEAAPDSLLAAIEAASAATKSNPPPEVKSTETGGLPDKVKTAPLPKTVAPVAVVADNKGENAVFGEGTKNEETPASIAARLSPAMAADKDLDPLTKERARIRLVGDYEAMFRGDSLYNVVRALADHAGMKTMLPSADVLTQPVSTTGTLNILDLFDLLVERYGLGMTYERGVWIFYHATPNAPYLKVYELSDYNRAKVTITSPTIATAGGSGGASGSGTTGTGNTGSTGNSNSGGTGGASGGGSVGTIEIDYKPLVDDIKDFLKAPTPPGEGADLDSTATTVAGAGKDQSLPPKYIPETNELYVVATPYQHKLVQGYLNRLDKPLEQVEFTAHFIEVTTSPTQNYGVNWSNSIQVSAKGTGAEANRFIVPKAGLISSYNFAALINAVSSDSKAVVIQEPTVVGFPWELTVINATTQIPVASSTFNTGSSSTAAGSTSSSLAYIDVGTIVTIRHEIRHHKDGKVGVLMHVSLVVSSLVGNVTISGNPAPETASRSFQFSAEVPEGDSLGCGGLISSSSTTSNSGVSPVLSNIPVLGHLFRADNDQANRTRMMVFITPRLVRDGDSGATMETLPRIWPADAKFHRPTFNARQDGSLAAVKASLAGFDRELSSVRAFIEQKRDPADIKGRLTSLSNELKAMVEAVKALRRAKVAVDAGLVRSLDAYEADASKLRREVFLSMSL